MFTTIGKIAAMFFGSASNGKGIVSEVSETIDKWNPSETTKHTMNIEDQTAGDESQKAAQQFVPAPSHDSWLDVLIDAVNRSIRPLFSVWAFGVLCGLWNAPQINTIDPFVLNIIWTIIGFWFGARVLFKDVPSAIMAFKQLKK